MTVSELKIEMDQRFAQVDERFVQVDARFDEMQRDMNVRFAEMRSEMEARFSAMDQIIGEEGAATRRHMDIAVEHLRGEFRLVVDSALATGAQIAAIAAVNAAEHNGFVRLLDNHEARLKSLENR